MNNHLTHLSYLEQQIHLLVWFVQYCPVYFVSLADTSPLSKLMIDTLINGMTKVYSCCLPLV